MPHPKPSPCRVCGKRHKGRGFCAYHLRQWKEEHAHTECSHPDCSELIANPANERQPLGRTWQLTDGTIVRTCRQHLPWFLTEILADYRDALLAELARVTIVDEHGSWIASVEQGAVRQGDYRQIRVPGTKGSGNKILAHHAGYALFHGGWKQDEQVHHRSQQPAEWSPWTLQAIKASKHEAEKATPADRTPQEVPHLELLEQFAEKHGLPLPWKQEPEVSTPEVIEPTPEKVSSPLLFLFGEAHPGLLEPAPVFEIPAPNPKPKRLRLAGTNITFEPITYTEEFPVDNVIRLDQHRPQAAPQTAARSFLEATAAPRELTLDDHRRMQAAAAAEFYRLQDLRAEEYAENVRETFLRVGIGTH